MKHFATLFSFLFILSFSNLTTAQDSFFLNGTAIATNDSCFQLTPTINWQVGSIWNGEMINLNESFEVVADLFLGCTDLEGADGMVFGLQPISTSIGEGGGDLGFGNVEPSLGIEFDTYQNIDFGDPTFDHISVIRDGILNHTLPNGALAGPIQADATNANVEDCQYHVMQINWDADSQTLSIYFDCELRLSYTADIVNDIFGGDPMVFWGFTSATGGLNNVHEVCFSYTSILDGLVDQTICPGEEIQLEASGGETYAWTPGLGLSDSTIANPIAMPEETTLYTVEITNDCGISFFDDVLITVDNDQFNVEIEVAPSGILPNVPSGTELSLSANVTPDTSLNFTYSWESSIGSTFSNPDSSSTNLIASLSQTGEETITVEVMSENGCVFETSITFEIIGTLYGIPNVFTPNGDNVNDTFGVVTQAQITTYTCQIFNRWGQLVFETDSFDQLWDGTYNNDPAPSDVYIYKINFEIGELQVEEKGDLTLLR